MQKFVVISRPDYTKIASHTEECHMASGTVRPSVYYDVRFAITDLRNREILHGEKWV